MMMFQKEWALVGASLLALMGCSSTTPSSNGSAGSSNSAGSGSTAGGNASAGGSGSASCNASFEATTANNYKFSSTITLSPVMVKPKSEITFDWSAVTTDFMGHAMDPAKDVDFANLVLWSLSEADLQMQLNADSIAQKDFVTTGKSPTNNTATSVSLFNFLAPSGQAITKDEILPYMDETKYPPETNTYTLIISAGDLISGGRSRMIQAMKLDPASTNTMVKLTNDSTKLDYSVDLHSLTPTSVPAGMAALKVSFENIEKNAMGNDFLPTQITEVRVAHYTQTVAELEKKFLDLELIAENTWNNLGDNGTSVAGTDFTLDALKDKSGNAFTGVTSSGTWVLGLVCGSCKNPAPWYITVLKPCQ